MKTIYELQQISNRLRTVTEVNSISPEDTFGLQSDVLEYLADMEQSAEGLGIHKVYKSHAEMVADAEAPQGSDGKPLRFGQLVVIYDEDNPSQVGSGNVYAWQKGSGSSAWLLIGNLSNVHAFMQEIKDIIASAKVELSELVASNKPIRMDSEEAMEELIKSGNAKEGQMYYVEEED